jgi:NitT/TauT family transport system substrate-binding protein
VNRRHWLARAAAVAACATLGACGPQASAPLIIGAHPFPGYELLYLARHLGLLPGEQVRLIETPSASANLRALAAGTMHGACLTLDEVLTAREQGIDLSVVCVIDRSVGADVVIGSSRFAKLGSLEGCTIGVEQTATGAVMLDATLRAARLTLADVKIKAVPVDQHESQFAAGAVDVLVTYAPVSTRLLANGATQIFSSRNIPGRIIDTLALGRAALTSNHAAVRALVDAHFAARQAWLAEPARHAPALAARLRLAAAAVPAAFGGLEFPERSLNRELFAHDAAALSDTARALGQVMVRANLLQAPPELDGLFDGSYV